MPDPLYIARGPADQPRENSAPVRPWRPAQRSPLAIRDAGELYETPKAAVTSLIATGELNQFARGVVWEPAAGRGAIVRELRAGGFRIHATDLLAHEGADGEILAGVDFLAERSAPAGVGLVLTNPPYRSADNFIRHALTLGLPAIALLRTPGARGSRPIRPDR